MCGCQRAITQSKATNTWTDNIPNSIYEVSNVIQLVESDAQGPDTSKTEKRATGSLDTWWLALVVVNGPTCTELRGSKNR